MYPSKHHKDTVILMLLTMSTRQRERPDEISVSFGRILAMVKVVRSEEDEVGGCRS